MLVLLLGLFVVIYLHDATTTVEVVRGGVVVGYAEALPGEVWPSLSGWVVLLIVLLPKLFVGLSYWLACRRTRRRLGSERGQLALNMLNAMTSTMPLLLLCLFIVDLSSGALRYLRVPLQNTVLLDELLVMLPTLLTAVWGWYAYYPVDRRLREATIMRDADMGRPVYPLLTRGAYVVMQTRHQFGLLLPPLLAVFAWSEALLLLGPDFNGLLEGWMVQALGPLGFLIVFVCAPLIIRYVWQTCALPAGEVRDRMVMLCDQHGVRVRELLLWQTSGRMVNAAVTGLVSKVRYILLSDGLLDQLEPREVEAVMAHELAHVKCKHLVWMALIVVALLGTLEGGGYAALNLLAGPMSADLFEPEVSATVFDLSLNDPDKRMAIVSLPALAVALLAFGWVSRRIERQADVFAVKHLAMNTAGQHLDAQGRHTFDEASVHTMVHALQRVCDLNHEPIRRKNWRHGSIAWRQAHLRSLVGTPIAEAAVDRVLMRIKLATLVGLVITAVLYFA